MEITKLQLCDFILYVTNNAFTPTGKGTFGVLPNKQ